VSIPSRNVQRQLDDLRRELAETRAKVTALYSARDARGPAPRDVRLARTTTSQEYPDSSADTFEIVFLDGAFTPTPGTQAVTWTPRSATPQAVARSLIGPVIENAVVLVLRANNRWWIVGPSSATDCTIVRFIVLSSDPVTRTALGEIRARPFGCGIDDVPDTSVGGTVIEICDPGGCYFAAPNEELIGRMGWAKYVQPIGEVVCQPGEGSPVPQWEVLSLCCDMPACDEEQ
jgi:hypothetical protein